ncbi:MAG: hypothetical protein IPM51_06695 [Sphingobacteriaceae bacterium]|nr:hypothetical protein [Sphingobacteriaceae bacterium]
MSTKINSKIAAEHTLSNEILEVVMHFARLDFSQKIKGTSDIDVLNAIKVGVNMLGEELEHSVISLKEKDQILKEIHHRVKNNLQIISSLLNLQSEKINNPEFNALVLDCKNRINSIALVHELLLSSFNFKKISVNDYLNKLCFNLYASFKKADSKIEFVYDIPSDFFLDSEQILPLGLIINEVITNSLKYAFPENAGSIHISAKKLNGKNYINISDHSSKIVKVFPKSHNNNLGAHLIPMLVEQLDGELVINKDEGYHYNIIF